MSAIEIPIYDPTTHTAPPRPRYLTQTQTDGNGNYVISRFPVVSAKFGTQEFFQNPETFFGRMEIMQTLNIGGGRTVKFVRPIEFYIPATSFEEAWNLFESTAAPVLQSELPDLKPNNV